MEQFCSFTDASLRDSDLHQINSLVIMGRGKEEMKIKRRKIKNPQLLRSKNRQRPLSLQKKPLQLPKPLHPPQ
jgi:hypothetical protein